MDSAACIVRLDRRFFENAVGPRGIRARGRRDDSIASLVRRRARLLSGDCRRLSVLSPGWPAGPGQCAELDPPQSRRTGRGRQPWLDRVGRCLAIAVFRRPNRARDRSATVVAGALVGIVLVSQVGMPTQNAAVAMAFWTFLFWYFSDRWPAPPNGEHQSVASWQWMLLAAAIVVFAIGTLHTSLTSLRVPMRARQGGWNYVYGFHEIERTPGGDEYRSDGSTGGRGRPRIQPGGEAGGVGHASGRRDASGPGARVARRPPRPRDRAARQSSGDHRRDHRPRSTNVDGQDLPRPNGAGIAARPWSGRPMDVRRHTANRSRSTGALAQSPAMIATSDSTRRGADALLWTVYVLAPSFGAGLVHGVPLGPLGAVALLLIWWLVLVRGVCRAGPRLLPRAWRRCSSPSVIPGEPGVRGRYYADSAASAATPPDVTRVDRRLDYSNDATELPLASFDANQAFAAVWDGHWWTAAEAPHTFYLYAPGASAELVVDGIVVATVTPADGARTGVAAPSRGWHQVYVHLSSPYAAPRRFAAGEQIGGRQIPFSGSTVRTVRIAEWQLKFCARGISPKQRSMCVRSCCWRGSLPERPAFGRRAAPGGHPVRADRRTLRSRGHHRSVGVCLARGRPPVAALRRRSFSGSANLS